MVINEVCHTVQQGALTVFNVMSLLFVTAAFPWGVLHTKQMQTLIARLSWVTNIASQSSLASCSSPMEWFQDKPACDHLVKPVEYVYWAPICTYLSALRFCALVGVLTNLLGGYSVSLKHKDVLDYLPWYYRNKDGLIMVARGYDDTQNSNCLFSHPTDSPSHRIQLVYIMCIKEGKNF